MDYAVSLFDTMFSKSPDEIINQLEKNVPDFFVLYDDGFNYLTKMCLTNMREAAFKMISMQKKKDALYSFQVLIQQIIMKNI